MVHAQETVKFDTILAADWIILEPWDICKLADVMFITAVAVYSLMYTINVYILICRLLFLCEKRKK